MSIRIPYRFFGITNFLFHEIKIFCAGTAHTFTCFSTVPRVNDEPS
jgi:hypothetical protein